MKRKENIYPIQGGKYKYSKVINNESLQKHIFEPNGINVLIWQTRELQYQKGTIHKYSMESFFTVSMYVMYSYWIR